MNNLAVIEITVDLTEMKIFEKSGDGIKVIESISENIYILKEIAKDNELSFEKSKELSEILKKMKSLAKDYGVSDISIILGSCFKKISNLSLILDQIKLYSGLDIDSKNLDIRNILITKKLLNSETTLISKKENKFFLNIGTSNLDFYVFYKGHLLANESVEIGTDKLFDIMIENNLNFSKTQKFIQDYSSYLDFFRREIGRKKIYTLVVESENRLSRLKPLFLSEDLKDISTEDFKKVIKKMEVMHDDELIEILNCSLYDLHQFMSTLMIIDNIVTYFSVSKISFLDEDLKNIVATEWFFPQTREESYNELWKITLDSVIDNVRKHNLTLSNPRFVGEFGVDFFDALQEKHQLSDKYRRYLIVASYLYDIGKFVSFKGHNKHSCYLIENSNIFGLSEKDLKNIAFLIYAHSSNISTIDLYNFRVDKEEFVKLLKVASILKIAVSLDQSKKQKIIDYDIFLNKNRLRIDIETREDFFIEKYKFNKQVGLFKYVFDLEIDLEVKRRYYGD